MAEAVVMVTVVVAVGAGAVVDAVGIADACHIRPESSPLMLRETVSGDR